MMSHRSCFWFKRHTGNGRSSRCIALWDMVPITVCNYSRQVIWVLEAYRKCVSHHAVVYILHTAQVVNAVCYSEHSHSLINSDPYRRQYIYTKYTKTVKHQVVPGVSLSSQCWHIVTIYQKKKKNLYAHVNMLYNLDFIHKWHKAGLGSNQI